MTSIKVTAFAVPFLLSAVLGFALATITCCGVATGVSTGTIEDPVLIASGPTAADVLATATALRGADRRALDCGPLVGTNAGVLMCSLLVSCALPLGEQMVFSGIEFPGDVGIAPAWARGAITIHQRQAVTSCVLANLSNDGLLAVVSMRGLMLEVSTDELEGWTEEEGAFYGDLMAPSPVAVACRGVADPAVSMRHNRLCAQPDPNLPRLTLCGLAYAGACPSVCGGRHGPYRRCDLGRREFARVITAFDLPN